MDYDCLNVEDLIAFDWDDGNILKNETKHGLKWNIIEEVFFNEPLLILKDQKHSTQNECRCVALGFIDDGLLTTVIFTKRDSKIRVISARPMSRNERSFYEKHTKV